MYLAHESSGNHNTYTRGITHWAGMLVGEHMQKGHEAYIVNLMFWPIPGSEEKIVQQMHSEAHRAYRLLLNRIVRDWHSKANVGRLPVWILVPDRPVYKREKKSLREVSINNGLHLNGVILNSPEPG
jgi:hypothetical protein